MATLIRPARLPEPVAWAKVLYNRDSSPRTSNETDRNHDPYPPKQ